mgnify:FL=1
MNVKNLSLVTDFYELTMSNGYFGNNMQNTIAYFDVFFRKIPDGRWLCYLCRARAGYWLC